MPTLTIAGEPVIEARISLPRLGAWTADVFADTDKALSGAVTIATQGGTEYKGTVDPLRSGTFVSGRYVRVVGGAGGLGKIAAPAFYNNPTVRVVLSRLLSDAGESLSPSSSSSELGRSAPRWTVLGVPTGTAISALLRVAASQDAIWRVLRDGAVFVGSDSFDAATGLGDAITVNEDPNEGRLELAVDEPLLQPGQSVEGRRASYVEHLVTPEKTRTFVWYES